MEEKKPEMKKFLPGAIIFNEGELGETAYILKQGRVEITMDVSGEKVRLAELTPEAVFGEMAVLLRGQRRTATATAVDYSEALEVDKRFFIESIDNSHPIVKAALGAAVERLRETTEKLHNAPDVFLATTEVLNLFVHQRVMEVEYFQAIRAISEAVRVELGEVEGVVRKMADGGLVELVSNERGKKVVRILKERDFSFEAKRLYRDLQKG